MLEGDMIKTIQIGEEQVSFSTAFAWAFVYKSQFRKDPAQVLIPAIKDIQASSGDSKELGYQVFERLGFVEIANIAWSMAKLCDKDIPDPITWITAFDDDFNVSDIVQELLPEAIESCFTTKKSIAPAPKKRRKTVQKS